MLVTFQPRGDGGATNDTDAASGRGLDYYDEHDHYHETTTTTAKPMKQGRYTDPWAGYYDWIINEGSFKFWSVFQVLLNCSPRHLKHTFLYRDLKLRPQHLPDQFEATSFSALTMLSSILD